VLPSGTQVLNAPQVVPPGQVVQAPPLVPHAAAAVPA
jgi:hypothetical protein